MMSLSRRKMQNFLKIYCPIRAIEKRRKTRSTPGTILKGRIVEITKDHVVVDVRLKIGRARSH